MLRSILEATLEYLHQPALTKAGTRENQVKLTVSVPPSLHVLLRSWAVCEGRELTSVVLQCVELSVRQLKSNGSIPSAAIRNYEAAYDERLAIGGGDRATRTIRSGIAGTDHRGGDRLTERFQDLECKPEAMIFASCATSKRCLLQRRFFSNLFIL